MTHTTRKILSLVLALALLVSTVPVAPARAEENSAPVQTGAGDGGAPSPEGRADDGSQTPNAATGDTYLDANGALQPIPSSITEITNENTPTTWGDTVNDGWYIVREEVTINGPRVIVSGDVHLILADGASLTVNGGIGVNAGNSLTIYAQSTGEQMGKLTAEDVGAGNAGIGGTNGSAGTITINGGNVTATGGDSGGDTYGGAGIGGGASGAGGTIEINGGSITATSGGGIMASGAGIGGGRRGAGGIITITGGTVEANGGNGGAGIGGGSNGNAGTIEINGGSVTAIGSLGAAGIGGGHRGAGGIITITGGSVTATGNSGAGIGGGLAGAGGTFSTGEDGQAVIIASSISDQSQNGSWSGLIIQGNTGVLYGSTVTPSEDFTIPAGTTVTIDAGKTLIINEGVTMTNNGTITNNGTMTNEGTITNNGTIINKGTINGSITGNQPTVLVIGVSLDPTSLSLTTGESDQLTATVEPTNATNKNLTWTSDNESVATVDENGNVTAVGAGTAAITVTTADGSFTATCTVTVTAPAEPVEPDDPPYSGDYNYAVQAPECDNGQIILDKEDRYANAGETVSFTVVPDDGYDIESVSVTTKGGTTLDLTDEGDGVYSFVMPEGAVTLSATFVESDEPAEPEEPEEPEVTEIFSDLHQGAWYLSDVQYVYDNGLMTGVDDSHFAPDTAMTRAMFVSVLARIAGEDTPAAPGEPWYAGVQKWAMENGVSDGTMMDDAISREQLVTMLHRYAGNPEASGDLSAYSDATSISDYAQDAMRWAVGEGILGGMTADTLFPQGEATRVQVAAMLQRFLSE